ncbi:LysM peptidoglycan-binding domain-containing protein [Glaciihabitans sp. dw_435]|uniref:LysM peptidoglycan-binding domain-containing protein n=1 Tax=Glaciihabitans sp. dw_435 TaxID=2720081 RepID=UPI0021039E9B|nr:LysM peptidoglycan-binding domain-containing protein [Glaciihabitans sp. dw_435]
MSSAVMGHPVQRSFVAHNSSADAERTQAPKSHLRITARGRAVLLTLVTTPLVVGALLLAINSGGAIATDSGSATPLETVTVFAGESLWQLAEDIAPNSDPRDVIADIVSLNQLDSSSVHPGQQLDVPAKYSN